MMTRLEFHILIERFDMPTMKLFFIIYMGNFFLPKKLNDE